MEMRQAEALDAYVNRVRPKGAPTVEGSPVWLGGGWPTLGWRLADGTVVTFDQDQICWHEPNGTLYRVLTADGDRRTFGPDWAPELIET